MRLHVRHATVYDYSVAVRNNINQVWMQPLTDERQTCMSFALSTSPRSKPRSYVDYFGNTVHHFEIALPHTQLQIVAEADVLTDDRDTAELMAGDGIPYQPLDRDNPSWIDFLMPTDLTAASGGIRALAAALVTAEASTAQVALAAARRVHAAFTYRRGVTGVSTTAEAALDIGAGVCQDYAHVLLSVVRHLGIPARYVSGYLFTGAGAEQELASHAWVEVYLPSGGWAGLDPTNDKLVDGHYVKVALGRDYADVPPVRGAYAGAAGSGLNVEVRVSAEEQQQQ